MCIRDRELLAPGDGITVNEVALANIHATTTCSVDLYIEKKLTGRFYILKAVDLPVGVTLTCTTGNFSNAVDEYGLYIKLTKSASEVPTVDVILK